MERSDRMAGWRRLPTALLIGAASLATFSWADDPPPHPPEPAADGPSGPLTAGTTGGDSPAAPPADGEAPAPAVTPAGQAARKLSGRIRGTVTDATQRTQSGLLVTLSSRSEPDLLRVTGTNEKGVYLFQELPPGIYDLKVQADGYQDTGKENIEVRPPFQNIVDVRLLKRVQGTPSTQGAGQGGPEAAGQDARDPAPITVRGRFVDQEKRPLVEVSVVLASLLGKGIHQAYSGSDGVFEIPGVIPGRYRVVVRSPGHVPLDLRSVDIQGKLGLTVSLMLVDYPLNFKAGQESATPLEEPRRAPPPAVTEEEPPAAAASHDDPAARDHEPEPVPGG